MSRRGGWFLWCMCLLAFSAIAQDGHVAYDSVDQLFQQEDIMQEDLADRGEAVPFVPRTWSADSIEAMRRHPDFVYMQYIDSVLRSRGQYKVPDRSQPVNPEASLWEQDWLRGLMWGMALAGVIFLVWRLFFGRGAAFARNRRMLPTTENQEEDLASLKDYGQLANEAADAGQYRLAVRYLYLQTLVLMAGRQIIVPSPQKTNQQLLDEIKGLPLAPDFARVVLHYEYVWFGQFPLNAQLFDTVQQHFKNFHRQWL